MRTQEKSRATTGNGSHKRCNKDNHNITQLIQIRNYFFENNASRFMAAIDTGIPIQNVCRYVEMLFKTDSIAIIKKDKCRVSGEHVEFLSCNSELFPKSNQLTLFEL